MTITRWTPVLGVTVLLVGCSSSGSAAPATFDARGQVTLVGGESTVRMSHDGSCWGIGRATSFNTGTRVVVSGGAVRRSGTLGRSLVDTDSSGTVITGCTWDFRVPQVPKVGGAYTVQVGSTHRSVDAATLRKGVTIRVAGVQ